VELEERERNTIVRRIEEAHLPRMKTLEERGLSLLFWGGERRGPLQSFLHYYFLTSLNNDLP
jgi:hypothetical protein